MCHGHEDLDETTKDYLRSINLPFLTWYWFEETGTVAIQRDRHSQGVQYNQVRHIYVCCNAWTWISVKWGTCYCQKKCISISWECLLVWFHSELKAKKTVVEVASFTSPVCYTIRLRYWRVPVVSLRKTEWQMRTSWASQAEECLQDI